MTNLSILSVNQGDLPRNSRIELKTNSDIKDVLRHAATSCGVDLTSFILQAAAEKARQILLESQVLFLSSSMFDKVNDSINNPPAPSASLLTLLAGDTFGDVEESRPRGTMTNQIYFFYTNYAGESRKMKVSMYQTRDKIVHGFNIGPKKMIRCNDCQANDWVDDGRNLNEYTCNCCGNFITVTEMRK